jgi:hypothetical protein
MPRKNGNGYKNGRGQSSSSQANLHPFPKGITGNPLGSKSKIFDVDLAQLSEDEACRRFCMAMKIIDNPKSSDKLTIEAIGFIWDFQKTYDPVFYYENVYPEIRKLLPESFKLSVEMALNDSVDPSLRMKCLRELKDNVAKLTNEVTNDVNARLNLRNVSSMNHWSH